MFDNFLKITTQNDKFILTATTTEWCESYIIRGLNISEIMQVYVLKPYLKTLLSAIGLPSNSSSEHQ